MIFYDLLLACALPFIAKKRHHYRRLFAQVPDPNGKEVVWIHAVSVGEAKAAQSLFRSLRESYPEAFFLITTVTEAGLAEARRSLPEADAFAYLPIDFRWIVRKWVRRLRPKLFLLMESDFWPNLLSAIKDFGGKIALVSGKLSERSAARFQTLSFFSKKLFRLFDLLCVQNEEQALRFLPIVDSNKMHITGNIKLDQTPERIDANFWRHKLFVPGSALTLSCTHAPEEELLLDLLPLEEVFCFLAPRHPERFDEVAAILEKKSIPFFRWSRIEERRGGERVLLVDVMGRLPICYTLSRLAIVAGSFAPHVGGHNLFEPCLYGTPVFFGPHMFAQKELATRVLQAQAGQQMPASSLGSAIQHFFSNPSLEDATRSAVRSLVDAGRGSAAKTMQLIEEICSLLRKV